MGKNVGAKKKFASSKGFLTMKGEDMEQMMRSSFTQKKDEGEICPYASCGRKFVS